MNETLFFETILTIITKTLPAIVTDNQGMSGTLSQTGIAVGMHSNGI